MKELLFIAAVSVACGILVFLFGLLVFARTERSQKAGTSKEIGGPPAADVAFSWRQYGLAPAAVVFSLFLIVSEDVWSWFRASGPVPGAPGVIFQEWGAWKKPEATTQEMEAARENAIRALEAARKYAEAAKREAEASEAAAARIQMEAAREKKEVGSPAQAARAREIRAELEARTKELEVARKNIARLEQEVAERAQEYQRLLAQVRGITRMLEREREEKERHRPPAAAAPPR